MQRKKIIIGSAVAAIVIIVAAAGFFLLTASGLKTISYNNNVGQTYSLPFYSKYRIQAPKDTTLPGSATAGVKDLVSEVSKEGKAPLLLRIQGGNNEAAKKGYESLKNCTSDQPKAFTVHNTEINENINVCRITTAEGKDIVYGGVFKQKDFISLFLIREDVDSSSVTSDASAKQALAKVSLQVYRKDIIKILTTIQVEKK